jgi:hypothetical protein
MTAKNPLAELRRLNQERTQGPWSVNIYAGDFMVQHTVSASNIDLDFIDRSANLMGKILDALDAAHERLYLGHSEPCGSMLKTRDCSCGYRELDVALKALTDSPAESKK